MPTYDYACKKCGHRFEAFQSMSDPILTTCPQCSTEALQRMIGAGAGLHFKGSGFYLTDYKKSGAAPTNGSSTSKNGSSSVSDSGSASSGESSTSSGEKSSSSGDTSTSTGTQSAHSASSDSASK
ncbi:MAG: zinc ribbon domain-containing protein [Bacteroidota bacterium]